MAQGRERQLGDILQPHSGILIQGLDILEGYLEIDIIHGHNPLHHGMEDKRIVGAGGVAETECFFHIIPWA